MSWWHRQHERLHLVSARSARRQGPPRSPFPEFAIRFDMAERVAKRARVVSRTIPGPPRRGMPGMASVAGEISQSYFVHNRHGSDLVRRKIDTFVGPMIDYQNVGRCLNSGIGLQGVNDLFFMGDYTDLLRIFDLLRTTYPEIDQTASDRAAHETGLMYINDMDATSEYCNMGNVIVWITIYDLVKSGSDRLNVAVDEANTFTPGSTWIQGVDEQRNDSATYTGQPLSYNMVGALPTDAHRFGQEWHIYQHTRVALNPGSVHQHHVRFGANSFVDFSDIQRANAGETAYTKIADYLKGTTYAQLVVQHGCVCANTLGTEATYTRSDVCVVTHKRYKFRYAVGQAEYRSGLNTLDVTAAPNIVNPETGDVMPYADAVP